LLEVFPVLPLTANVSLGVGALSCAEQFNILVVTDRDAHPDLDVLTMSAEDDLRSLAASSPRVGVEYASSLAGPLPGFGRMA
jgi:hypothetical protein